MLAVQGYYDGNKVRTLEKINAKKNQELIITILDQFIDDAPTVSKNNSARGTLAKYANPSLWEFEDTAWEKAVADNLE